jgi:hypothetical protein
MTLVRSKKDKTGAIDPPATTARIRGQLADSAKNGKHSGAKRRNFTKLWGFRRLGNFGEMSPKSGRIWELPPTVDSRRSTSFTIHGKRFTAVEVGAGGYRGLSLFSILRETARIAGNGWI